MARSGRRVRWGQNFLVNRSIARWIVDWAAVDGRRVLEIGPGQGALTDELVDRVEHLWLVEIDAQLAAALSRRYADRGDVTVVHADVFALDLLSLVETPVVVVANLPYESGTAILSRLLAQAGLVEDMVVMLQREVCDRLAAGPGSRQYGMLSVHTQLRADVELGRRVGSRSFRPPPKVESRVVRLRPLDEPRYAMGREDVFADLVRRAFAGRRKMVRNTIGAWLVERVGRRRAVELLEAAKIEPAQRPATIPVAGFAALSAAVSAILEQGA